MHLNTIYPKTIGKQVSMEPCIPVLLIVQRQLSEPTGQQYGPRYRPEAGLLEKIRVTGVRGGRGG